MPQNGQPVAVCTFRFAFRSLIVASLAQRRTTRQPNSLQNWTVFKVLGIYRGKRRATASVQRFALMAIADRVRFMLTPLLIWIFDVTVPV